MLRFAIAIMNSNLSFAKRLDLAASAELVSRLISRARFLMSFVSPLLILLAFGSEAPYRETLLVSVVAGIAVVATAVLWPNWRYKVYPLALFCFALAACDVERDVLLAVAVRYLESRDRGEAQETILC